MAETGIVIQINKNLLQLEIPRSKACSGCRACVPLNGKDSMTTYALNLCNAQIGDRVEIEPGEPRQLFSSFLLYGIPLLVFMGLIFLCSWLTSELTAVIIALLGLAVTYFLIHFLANHFDDTPYTHKAIRVLPR